MKEPRRISLVPEKLKEIIIKDPRANQHFYRVNYSNLLINLLTIIAHNKLSALSIMSENDRSEDDFSYDEEYGMDSENGHGKNPLVYSNSVVYF